MGSRHGLLSLYSSPVATAFLRPADTEVAEPRSDASYFESRRKWILSNPGKTTTFGQGVEKPLDQRNSDGSWEEFDTNS